jgi:hypothetical protein
MPDDIDQLISQFRERGSAASPAWKLGVVMELERLRDERIVPFLIEVLVDHRQPTEVRTHVLRRVKNGGIPPDENGRVAAALIFLLGETSNADLRTHTTLALGALTDVDRVLLVLGSIALDESAPLDLRYAAFSSLDRAGPTERSIAILRTLAADETLGRTARSTLHAWRADQETSDDDDDD